MHRFTGVEKASIATSGRAQPLEDPCAALMLAAAEVLHLKDLPGPTVSELNSLRREEIRAMLASTSEHRRLRTAVDEHGPVQDVPRTHYWPKAAHDPMAVRTSREVHGRMVDPRSDGGPTVGWPISGRVPFTRWRADANGRRCDGGLVCGLEPSEAPSPGRPPQGSRQRETPG